MGSLVVPPSSKLPDFSPGDWFLGSDPLSPQGGDGHRYVFGKPGFLFADGRVLACSVQSLLSQAVLPVLPVPPLCEDHSQEEAFGLPGSLGPSAGPESSFSGAQAPSRICLDDLFSLVLWGTERVGVHLRESALLP